MSALKAILQRASNQFNSGLKDNIFFLHIPKCGGASISQAISSRYYTLDIRKDRRVVALDAAASSGVVRMVEHVDYPNDTTNDYSILKLRESLLLYFMGQKDVRYITGHFILTDVAHREFRDKYRFVTVLRDPIKRWISAYFYNRYKDVAHRKIEADMMSYLKSPFGRSQGYEYVKFLGGAEANSDYSSKAAIDRAKANLQNFNVVGILEHQDTFLKQFENLFGVRLKLIKKNQSPKPEAFRRSIITPDVEEEIRRICQPDLEIYRFAVENFLDRSV